MGALTSALIGGAILGGTVASMRRSRAPSAPPPPAAVERPPKLGEERPGEAMTRARRRRPAGQPGSRGGTLLTGPRGPSDVRPGTPKTLLGY